MKAKAAAVGVDVSSYAASLLEKMAQAPLSLEEISGEIAKDFARSGMTEDELSDFLEKEKHEMRAEKRARRNS